MLLIHLCYNSFQISGDLDIAKDALIQVTSRLRANLFEREGGLSALVPVLPYVPMSTEAPDSLRYESRDAKRHGRGQSYSGGYGSSSDLPPVDGYGSYTGLQVSITLILYYFYPNKGPFYCLLFSGLLSF